MFNAWYPLPTIWEGIEWVTMNSTLDTVNTIVNVTSNAVSQFFESCTNVTSPDADGTVRIEGVENEFACGYGGVILTSTAFCFMGSNPMRVQYECSCDSFGCKFPIAPTDQEALTDLPATDDSPTPLNSTTTESPTANPTNRPTDSPAVDPTNRPTDSPAVDPTNRPTDSPTGTTESPAVDPTNRPTDSPTADAPTHRQPFNGDLRQEKTHDSYLEVYYNGSWRPVCDDEFETVNTHVSPEQAYKNAKVACRQLGLPYQYATAIQGIETRTFNFWLDMLECTGNESSLESCRRHDYGVENCYSNEGVYIECPSRRQTTEPPPTTATPSHNATRTTGTVSNDHKPWSEHHWYVYLIAGVVVAAVIVIAIVVSRKRKSGGGYGTNQPYPYQISIERLIF